MKMEVKAFLKSYYSQTCSNCHLYKVTNTESAQANSDTIVTVQDIHLSNVTSNHFFCLPNKKNLSKTTTTKLYPAKKWETNIRQQGIKINFFLIIFTLLLLYNAKFV